VLDVKERGKWFRGEFSPEDLYGILDCPVLMGENGIGNDDEALLVCCVVFGEVPFHL
jgi:hypothetical protein